MRKLNDNFYNIATKNDWVDLSNFWTWPLKEILDDVKKIPNEYWAKPFDGGKEQNRKNYNNTDSNIYLPGTEKNTKLIPARGWKSVMFLNDTGISDTQILTFKPVYDTIWQYKDKWNYIKDKRTWTNVAQFSPKLQNFFEENIFPYIDVGYIFITALESGGVITEHNDIPEGSVSLLNGPKLHSYDMCNAFNLCLNHVDNCYAVFNNKVMPSYEGCLMWTHTGKQHWVLNMNKEIQYKIIFQGFFKKPFREKVVNDLAGEYLNDKELH